MKHDVEWLDKFKEERAQIIKTKTVVDQPKEIPVKSSTPTIVFGLPERETSISYDDLLKSPR